MVSAYREKESPRHETDVKRDWIEYKSIRTNLTVIKLKE